MPTFINRYRGGMYIYLAYLQRPVGSQTPLRVPVKRYAVLCYSLSIVSLLSAVVSFL